MIKKFPKQVAGKWKRYNLLEKGFLAYTLLLWASIIFLPLISYTPLNTSTSVVYTLYNTYFLHIAVMISICLAVLFVWNLSYRFKNAVHMLIGFKDNDAFINFILLWIIGICYIAIGDNVNLVKNNYINTYTLDIGYYTTGLLIIIGLIYNLFLAISFSKNRKKHWMVTMVGGDNHNPHANMDESLKKLFE